MTQSPDPPLETSRTLSCLLLAYTDQACVTALAYQCLGKPDVSLLNYGEKYTFLPMGYSPTPTRPSTTPSASFLASEPLGRRPCLSTSASLEHSRRSVNVCQTELKFCRGSALFIFRHFLLEQELEMFYSAYFLSQTLFLTHKEPRKHRMARFTERPFV